MIDLTSLKAWLQLPETTRLNIYNETGRQMGLPGIAVEKDWWVEHTLWYSPFPGPLDAFFKLIFSFFFFNCFFYTAIERVKASDDRRNLPGLDMLDSSVTFAF